MGPKKLLTSYFEHSPLVNETFAQLAPQAFEYVLLSLPQTGAYSLVQMHRSFSSINAFVGWSFLQEMENIKTDDNNIFVKSFIFFLNKL